jgi:hypothetical protein
VIGKNYASLEDVGKWTLYVPSQKFLDRKFCGRRHIVMVRDRLVPLKNFVFFE